MPIPKVFASYSPLPPTFLCLQRPPLPASHEAVFFGVKYCCPINGLNGLNPLVFVEDTPLTKWRCVRMVKMQGALILSGLHLETPNIC